MVYDESGENSSHTSRSIIRLMGGPQDGLSLRSEGVVPPEFYVRMNPTVNQKEELFTAHRYKLDDSVIDDDENITYYYQHASSGIEAKGNVTSD